MDARVALTLRLIGGLTTIEIARAFLVTAESDDRAAYRAREAHPLRRRVYNSRCRAKTNVSSAWLDAVLEVLYLIFNEGYSASGRRRRDATRAVRGRDARGPRAGRADTRTIPRCTRLIALMEIQASRTQGARRPHRRRRFCLLDQDRGKWDHLLIGRGTRGAGTCAERLGGARGPYALQAAIAACHARARTSRGDRLAAHRRALRRARGVACPSPVIELNRAVAIGMAYGPAAGLALVEDLLDVPALQKYHLLPSVQADLLEKLARYSEAQAAFERAAALAQNTRDRTLLLERATRCARA